jgi:hypothetical protein
MEAVEPLSGFEVGGPPTYPQTKSGGVNIFFYIITYYICEKVFFLIFRFISFRIWNCPLAQNFVPLLMKQLLSELKTSDLSGDFFIVFPRTIKTMRYFCPASFREGGEF